VFIVVALFVRRKNRKEAQAVLSPPHGTSIRLQDFESFAGAPSADSTLMSMKTGKSGNTTIMNTSYGSESFFFFFFLFLVVCFLKNYLFPRSLSFF